MVSCGQTLLDSTDSRNLLGGIELNSTTPPQSQQMQHRPMIIPSTSVHSLQPTAVGMGFPEMVSHGVGSPQASIHSTGEGYTSHGGGGGEQSEMMPGGQHVNQVQMARPGWVRMAMGQQDTPPHVIPSYNPPTGAGVGPFAAVSQSPLMSLGPTLRTFSEQGVQPHMIPNYNPPVGAGVHSKLSATVPQFPLMSVGPTLRTFSEQGVSPQHASPPSQHPHTPPPPLPSAPQMLPHSQPQTLSPMNQPQSSSSSLQLATTSSAPSTSQLQPQGVPQPGSSTQKELVSESESLVCVTLTVFL